MWELRGLLLVVLLLVLVLLDSRGVSGGGVGILKGVEGVEILLRGLLRKLGRSAVALVEIALDSRHHCAAACSSGDTAAGVEVADGDAMVAWATT